jgi:amino acid adenylation domain-containing protein
MLAVLKSGAAYVPIDPAYPQMRVQYILDDSQLAIVIADAQGSAALGAHKCSVIHTDDFDAEPFLRDEPCSNPTTRLTGLSASDLAYVIYTSGSTGHPKGVLIEHRNAASFVEWALGQFTEDDLSWVLAATSICFDLSLFELFVPLAAGGRVKLVDNVLALRDHDMGNVSLINTVPSAIRSLLEANAIPPSVRCINLAGELLRQELVDALYAQLGSVKIHDLYGPSESTTYSTFSLRTRGGDATIGRPIANTQVYVFDERGHPLPTGMTGELYIGGAGVARGYLNRPTVTAEKFAVNRHTGTRLYRTGDSVRLAADGRLQYIGRKDGQEKIRGHRVEPGEIEACLLEHPLVADCAVMACTPPGQVDGKFLVAYIVEIDPTLGTDAAKGDLLATDLADFLAARLPPYMVPTQFVPLSTLPLTPNGKVDRRALPAPGDATPRKIRYVAPRSDVERRLCALWQTVLKQETVGVNDNFFAHGGDSLLLLKLASAIEGEFDLRVDLPLLFASPSIEMQAQLLAQQLELAHLLRTVNVTEESSSSSFVDL